MATIGKDLVRPSDIRKPFFTGYNPGDASYSFDCLSCGSTIDAPIKLLSNFETNVDPNLIYILKEHFGIGLAGKTRDGGWPAFHMLVCSTCEHRYVILSGVQEPSHSFIIVTIQGICEIF